MDSKNLSFLKSRTGSGSADIRLLLNTPPGDVPDPYYEGPEGFENVYRLVRDGSEKLLKTLI